VCCRGIASQDPSRGGRVRSQEDSIAQGPSDRDKIEHWAGSGHRDVWNRHGVQSITAKLFALFVVELKGCYSLRDDLSLSVGSVGGDLVLNDKQDGRLPDIDKADIRFRRPLEFTANGKRDDEMGD